MVFQIRFQADCYGVDPRHWLRRLQTNQMSPIIRQPKNSGQYFKWVDFFLLFHTGSNIDRPLLELWQWSHNWTWLGLKSSWTSDVILEGIQDLGQSRTYGFSLLTWKKRDHTSETKLSHRSRSRSRIPPQQTLKSPQKGSTACWPLGIMGGALPLGFACHVPCGAM